MTDDEIPQKDRNDPVVVPKNALPAHPLYPPKTPETAGIPDTTQSVDTTDTTDTTDQGSSAEVSSQPLVFSDDELLGAAAWSWFGDTEAIEDPQPAAHEPAPTTPPHTPPHAAPSDAPRADGPPYTAPSYPPPASGHHAPPPVRRLYRSNHDRKAGGVSAGLAEFFRVDPTLVRVVTLLFLFSGIGVFVYLVAWIIIPQRPAGFVDPAGTGPIANERTMTIAFGVAALAIAFGILTGSWAILSFALIAGGIWLLSEHTPPARSAPTVPPAPGMVYPPPEPRYEPPLAWSAPPTPEPAMVSAAVPPPPAPREMTPSRRRPRRRQSITWTVLSLLALLSAVGIAASSGGWWDVSATRFLGFGVVIIGVGVVAGQVRQGGARGLIPLGILAALALFPVSAVDGLLDEGIGESIHRPSSFSELTTNYEHGIGTMTVDLSRLDFEGRSETIDIDLGIGELIVILPEDIGGEAILEAGAGSVSHEIGSSNMFDFNDGLNVDSGTVRLAGPDGSIDLNISVGIGTAELRSEGQ